jgi:uncharacterized membrane protein|tara:strand:- start:22 stop:708 length:687 start_codon:yes stop_codon:yes gene_type:complete
LRIDELDSLKATALVMMLVSNFITDLNYFDIMILEKGDFWWWLARSTATLFVGLSGFSYYLADRKEHVFSKTFKRTQRLIFWAFTITIMTFLFEPNAYVRFGVLHLLAFASIAAFPLVRYPLIAFMVGISFFLIPLFPSETLVWLGLSETGLLAVDYFPLNPWFGVFLICIGLSSQIYPEGKPLLDIKWPEKWLFLGRNTLLIYVFHQPFLIALLIITGLVSLDQIIP